MITTIVTSRPLNLASKRTPFTDYELWRIGACNGEQFIEAYTKAMRINGERKARTLRKLKTEYMKPLVQSTPANLVWAIKHSATDSEELCLFVDAIVEEMVSRSDYWRIENRYAIKKLYEEIAYEFLSKAKNCMLKMNTWPGSYYDFVFECVESVKSDRRVKVAFFKNSEIDDRKIAEIGDQLYTKMSLIEVDDGNLRFLSRVFPLHLAARKLLAAAGDGGDQIRSILDRLPVCFRYPVLAIASAIALNWNNPSFTSLIPTDIRPDVEDTYSAYFSKYMWDRWEDSKLKEEEKGVIRETAQEILDGQYGPNIFTRGYPVEDHLEKMKKMAESS